MVSATAVVAPPYSPSGSTRLRRPEPRLSPSRRIARYGRSSVSPFLVGEDAQTLLLSGGGVAGFVCRGRGGGGGGDGGAGPAHSSGHRDNRPGRVAHATTWRAAPSDFRGRVRSGTV